MLHHYQTSTIFLIIFTIWIISLAIRSFDKTLRKYIIAIGISLIFWMILIIIKSDTTGIVKIFIWYLYYVPLIAIPTFYYNCSDYFSKKSNKTKRYIVMGISASLIMIVLTNNIHQLVFKVFNGDNDYTHEIGYYAICVWIFALLIVSVIKLAKISISTADKRKIIVPFVPILVGIGYTIVYILNIGLIREFNISNIIGVLFCIGLETFYRLDLIPNNFRYKEIFTNSSLPIEIISKDGNIKIATNHQIAVEENIINDIKNNNVPDKYIKTNKIQNIKSIHGGYAIEENDLTNINNIKKYLKSNNTKLIKQGDLLENQRKVKSEMYEIKLKNEIIESLEKKINDKKEQINKMLDEMDEKDIKKMYKIKMLISYCKRMSSLVISDYNQENYNNKRIETIINELFIEAKHLKIDGIIHASNFEISSNETMLIYETIFEIIYNLENVSFLLNIEVVDNAIYMKYIFDRKINNLKKRLYLENTEINEKSYENETELEVKILSRGE